MIQLATTLVNAIDCPNAITICDATKSPRSHAELRCEFIKQAIATRKKPTANGSLESNRLRNNAVSSARGNCGRATQRSVAPICSGRSPRIPPRYCGITMMVDKSTKRNMNRTAAISSVFRCRRKGRSTNGFGVRSRRTTVTVRRKAATERMATTVLKFTQPRRPPGPRPPKRNEGPKLQYKKASQLGRGPLPDGGGEGGMPLWTSHIISGVSRAVVQKSQCHDRCCIYQA